MIYKLLGRFPTLVIARRNISRAKIRSLLAAIAIAIGVFAVATVGATGIAFKSSQLSQLDEFGVGQVYLFPGPDQPGGSFSPEDVRQIQDTVPADVFPVRSGFMLLDRRNGPVAATVNYVRDPRQQFRIERGSLPPPNNWRRSAVVDAGYARQQGIAVGDRITLTRQQRTPRGVVTEERDYRVTAIAAESQTFSSADVYLPIAAADRERYTQITITTSGVDDARRAADLIDARFNDRREEIRVLELTFIVDLVVTITDSINRLLAILGGISMVVAAIAIANTMLMATIRRREEIGVLRAVGYRKRDILRILLAEAAMIGAIGGLIGSSVALAVTALANGFINGQLFEFTPGVALAFSTTQLSFIVAAFAFGVLISLLAGFYPAWQAANERPVEALRG